MGNLVFQATLGGQVNLVGPNTASTYNINVPAFSGTMSSLASVTNNGVNYVNSSGQPTSGSSFVFDGTNVGIGTSSPSHQLDVANGARAKYLQITNNGYAGSAATTPELYSPASATLAFGAGGAERMRLDSSGNLGIGTTSPGGKLQVVGESRFTNSSNAGLAAYYSSGTSSGEIAAYNWGGSAWLPLTLNAADVRFLISGTEKSRIDSSGNLLVGGTTQTNSAKVEAFFSGASNSGFVANDTTSTSGTNYFIASNNGTNIGSIQRVGATSAVVYNTTSDQRLKSNIEDAAPVLNKLMQVQVRQYDWTEGDLHQDYGFIAQELQPVLTGVVTQGQTEEDVWQLDYSRLTPHLVKAIQEQQTLITQLQADVAALKG